MRFVLLSVATAAAAAAYYIRRGRRLADRLRNCKLTYFPLSSRAESVRLALALAKIPFEDVRLSFAEWAR